MTKERKSFFDEITDTVENLAKELGLTDLIDELSPAKRTENSPDPEGASKAQYDALRKTYARLEQEIDGYKTRLAREQQQAIFRAEGQAFEVAFTVLDDLEGALQSLDKMELDPEQRAKIAEGFTMRREASLTLLARKYDVKPIPSLGYQANPQYHHVLSEIASEQPKGVIVHVVEVGYTRNGEMIREAKVVVAK